MLCAFSLLFVTACKKPCKGVECANGVCNESDGSCTCDAGWFKDANGKCTVQDVCYNKDCGHGTCAPADGTCLCDAGWLKDANGKCTVQDLCYNVDCGTHGTCDASDGSCHCVTGYEVNAAGKCDSVSRAKFIGTFGANDQCTIPAGGPFIYTIIITESATGINKVVINNYGGYPGLNALATITGNTIAVSDADYTANGHTYRVYSTAGTLTGTQGSFTLAYKVDQDGVADSDCTSVLTKQ